MIDLYLLSILENFGALFGIVSAISFSILIIALVVDLLNGPEDRKNDTEKFCIKNMKVFLLIGIISLFLSALIPTRRAIIESYIILEGKDLVNREKIENLFQWIDAKIDEAVVNESVDSKNDS
jgi:amino acid permease